MDFNPHTREGCDLHAGGAVPDLLGISIHTPVKGVTSGAARIVPVSSHFNPHTREGCDDIGL